MTHVLSRGAVAWALVRASRAAGAPGLPSRAAPALLAAGADEPANQAAMRRFLASEFDVLRVHALTDAEARARVARLLESGAARLVPLGERARGAGTTAPVAADAPAAPVGSSAPPAREAAAPPEPVEPSTLSPDLAPFEQARALRDAAREGTPFCEECERARRAASA